MPHSKISNKQACFSQAQNEYQSQISKLVSRKLKMNTNLKSLIGNLKAKFCFAKSEIRNWKFIAGYTLIEFIIVLGVLAMTVGAMTMFLTSVLRGTNKANVTAEVKQNGQALLDSLERQIRGAASVEQVGNYRDQIKLNRDIAEPLYIKCESRIDVGPDARKSRIVIQVAESPTNLGWRTLSNDDIESGISIDNCQLIVFTASLSGSGAPIPTVVSISFVAKKESRRSDFTASSKFETTISLRRY